jgi:hypothetical protein
MAQAAFSASMSSEGPDSLEFYNPLTRRKVPIALAADGKLAFFDGKLRSLAELRAQIHLPLELIQAEAYVFAYRRWWGRRHTLPPKPLIFVEYRDDVYGTQRVHSDDVISMAYIDQRVHSDPYVHSAVRLMFPCVAFFACQRLFHTTWHQFPYGSFDLSMITGMVMERVKRGRVRRVQVRLQRRACCVVLCCAVLCCAVLCCAVLCCAIVEPVRACAVCVTRAAGSAC